MNVQPPHPYMGRPVIVIHYSGIPGKPRCSPGVVVEVVNQTLVEGRGTTYADIHLFPAPPAGQTGISQLFRSIKVHQSFDAAVKAHAEAQGTQAQAYFP